MQCQLPTGTGEMLACFLMLHRQAGAIPVGSTLFMPLAALNGRMGRLAGNF
jgi:hypothetical protein